MKTYRYETVKGKLYYSSKIELKTQIKSSFFSFKFNPKNTSETKTNEFKAFIVPNDNYNYCGSALAHAYKKIKNNIIPELIVILGIDHNNLSSNYSLFPEGEWMTPLGEIKINNEFTTLLLKTKEFQIDKYSHLNEKSIELQLPFLKYIFKEKMPEIVPITIDSMNEDINIKNKVNKLFESWANSGKRILFICVSNLHSEKFKTIKRQEEIKKIDEKLIELINNLKIKEIKKYVKENKLNIDGINSIIFFLSLLKKMKGRIVKGEKLIHYFNQDITKKTELLTDYVSIEFR